MKITTILLSTILLAGCTGVRVVDPVHTYAQTAKKAIWVHNLNRPSCVSKRTSEIVCMERID